MTPPRVSKCKGIRNNYICVLALQHQLSTLLRISFYNKKKAFKVIWTKSDLLYLSLVIRLATRRQWHFKSKTREMYESTIQLSASMQRVLLWNWRTKNQNSNNNPHLLIWLKPVKILSLQMEWVLLVVPKDLKYDGLGSDVVHKWLGDLHCNLVRRKSSEAGVGDDEKAQACACSSPSALLSTLCMLGVSLHRPPTPHDRSPSGFVSNVTLPSVVLFQMWLYQATVFYTLHRAAELTPLCCCSWFQDLPVALSTCVFLCCTSEKAQAATLLGRSSLQSPGELVERIRKTCVGCGPWARPNAQFETPFLLLSTFYLCYAFQKTSLSLQNHFPSPRKVA